MLQSASLLIKAGFLVVRMKTDGPGTHAYTWREPAAPGQPVHVAPATSGMARARYLLP